MPRRKAAPVEFEEEFPTPSELEVENFLEEWAPQSSVVEIYEIKKDGGKLHQERVGIEILQADLYGYLRENYGSGKFSLQFKNATRRIVKGLTVEVGPGPKGTAPPISSNGPVNGQRTFTEELLLTMIAAQKPAPPLDLAGLGAILQALRPAPSGDPAAMLAAMATTFQQLKPAEDNVDKALTIISKAKDIAGNGGGDGDSWPGLIREGITTVAQVLRKPNEERPAIPPGAQPYTPIHQALVDNPPHREKTSDEILQEWLQAQLAFLKTKARAGKDPDFWAEYVQENAEEPGAAAILEALRRGATFQHLLTFDPEIGKDPVLAGWFQQFYEALSTPIDEDVDTSGAGGDGPHPGGDEKPSP